MPTIKQLPVATAVTSADVLPLSTGSVTQSVTVGTLLASTQPAITIPTGDLLGRVSAGTGGPESVPLGIGVSMQSGEVVATGQDHTGFAVSTALLVGDEVVINSAATPKRLVATLLRSLFTAGDGVEIDSTGVISATAAAGSVGSVGAAGPPGPAGPAGPAGAAGPAGTAVPATATSLGGIKPSTGLAVASDGTLTISDVSAAAATATGTNASRTIADRLADSLSLQDFGVNGYVPGSGGDDLPAFNAALSALSAKGGGRLLLPAGTFKVSASIVPPTADGMVPLEIVGQGDATIIEPSATMSAVIVVNEGNLFLADFALTNTNNLATSGVCVTKPADSSRCEFDRLTIASFSKGVWVQNGDVLHFNRPRIIACGTAFAIDNGMVNSSIAEMYAFGGNGIDVGAAAMLAPKGLQVVGGKILPSTTGIFGVRLLSGLDITFDGLVIDQLAMAGANGFLIDGSNATIRAIKLTDCWTGIVSGSTGTGSGIKIVGSAVVEVSIANHTWDSHGTFGLETTAGNGGVTLDLVVLGGRFAGDGQGDASLTNVFATFIGTEFNHPTSSISCAGSQALYSDIGCHFVAAPQVGTLAGGVSIGSMGTVNDRFVKTLQVTAGGLNVTGNSLFANNLTVSGLLTASSGLAVTGTIAASGAVAGSNLGNGSGDPTGLISASPGMIYQHLAPNGNIADHALWIKESTAGAIADATGWSAVATQGYVGRQLGSALPSLPVTALYGGSGSAGLALQVTPSSPLALSGGSLTVQGASNSQFGVVKVDGTTIIASASGVISAIGAGGANAGVAAWNGRTGSVTMTLGDITAATGTGSTAASNLGLAVVAGSGSYTDLSNKPTIPAGGTAAPTINGVASAGTAATFAHSDHVHPTDTSRAPLANPAFTGSITLPTWTTTTRPASPTAGMQGFATDTERQETYSGLAWVQYVRTSDLVSASAAGIAPASGGGTANFLRADGTWAPPPGGGGTYSAGTGLSLVGTTFSLGTVPLANLATTGAVNGYAIVLVNGVPTWSALAAGMTYSGTAPISVTSGAISIAIGAAANTVAAGNDSRIVGALQASAIPAAAGQLLGGSGTAGAAQAITLGSNLSLSGNTLNATGGSGGNPTPRIVTSSANATLLATDGLVCFNRTSSPGATTITLEASPAPGVVHRIKDMAGNAAGYPITVQPTSGTIDGAANFIINQNRGALTVEFNGSEWSIT